MIIAVTPESSGRRRKAGFAADRTCLSDEDATFACVVQGRDDTKGHVEIQLE
jgi:hypothetical protein